MNIEHLIRPNIRNLEPYTPILPFEVLSRQLGVDPADIIKLDANENPYGPSPRVAQALAQAAYLHIYPDPECRDLRAALADYTGLDADYILVGHGADELIDLLFRLVTEPGDVVINCPPTFGMYSFDAAVNAAEVINVRRRPDFSLPVDAVEAAFPHPALWDAPSGVPKLIFVTAPNNPDGGWLSDDDLRRLLALPALVVLDEAYIEFSAHPSRFTWVRDYPNLIVLRTFSKWAGLAGLRVGYGAFPLAIIEHLWKIKQPYNVNVAGQLAALVSLEDREYLLANVARIVDTRQQFYTALQGIDWLEPFPSQTNFILCRVHGRPAAEVKQALARQGILVRYYSTDGLRDCLRISIGTPEQMTRLETALKQL
ncbi:MAG: histidinol-phosphate transaminase [Chloroflexi bacterium]|nr:MAG: histidinol-phosphate transaminase [Chloroflexota bacterium]